MLYAPGEIANGHFIPFEAVKPSAFEMFSMRTLNFVVPFCANEVTDNVAIATTATKNMEILRAFMTNLSLLSGWFEVAPKDATLIVMVMKLCAASGTPRSASSENFRG